MNADAKVKLFLVDDDAVFLKLLAIEFLQHADFEVETYPTGELCIEHLSSGPDVIILDYHLDGIVSHAINGIETLDSSPRCASPATSPGAPACFTSMQATCMS